MTIYFYKANAPYGCFSNFSPHSIHLQGQDWPTVEHYYQAQKFAGTGNGTLMDRIRTAPTPEAAAAIGRDRTHPIRPDWEQAKFAVMAEAVRLKFYTHADIRTILLDTADKLIVEDSPTDYYWGCGLKKTGQNHLGKILMHVRQEIRESSVQH